jgi:hypothetical protein
MTSTLHTPAAVMPLMGTVALVRVMWTSLAATIVVTIAFSAAIRFIVRFSEMRLVGRRGAAVAYGGLAAFALSAFGAAIVYGLVLMARKS